MDGLVRFKMSGGKLILVTGRELEDLTQVGPDLRVFDFVVAENGALLYRPEMRKAQSLAGRPAQSFINQLHRRGVHPLSVGRSIVATLEQYAGIVDETIAEMNLDLEIVRNRSSLMVLPRGVNKGTGLMLALQELHLKEESVIGVGDAENDAPFLSLCGTAVAVANAIPSIKASADWVTDQSGGAGVVEVIDRVVSVDGCVTRGWPSQ